MAAFSFDAQAGETTETRDKPCYVSMFKSLADPTPTSITFDEFLDAVRDGDAKSAITRIRAEPDEEKQKVLKRLLPCVTLSGVFSGGHRQEHLVEHSGLICIDFDVDRNPDINGHAEDLRDHLVKDEFVRAAFVSARGNGVAAVCRIEDQRHQDAFDALQAHFKKEHGLVADPSCRDISRLRFLSWDADAKENVSARVFKRYSLAAEKPSATTHNEVAKASTMTPSRRDELLSALEKVSPDLRETWLQVGMALQSEAPGLDGFNLWARWSAVADGENKWNEQDAQRVWKSFGKRGGTNIETLFKLAYQAGWSGPPKVTPLHTSLPIVHAHVWAEEPEQERNILLDGFLDVGELGEVIAPSKCRKSFFVLQMAMSLAAGIPFLHWSATTPRKVLLVNLEVAAAWQHRRLLRMREAMGIDASTLDNLLIANTRGLELSSPLDDILATIREHRPSLVIIDPLYLVHTGDENAAVEMMPLIRRLQAISAENRASVLIVHHDPKGQAGDRNIRDRGSGSSVIGRAVDARITLTPHADSDELICVDVMARNHPPVSGFTATMESGCFAIDNETAYNPQTSATQGKRIDTTQAVSAGVAALVEDIRNAGPFNSDTLYGMIKDRCGKKTAVIAETKRELKRLARDGVIKMMTGRDGKEYFGPADHPSRWENVADVKPETYHDEY